MYKKTFLFEIHVHMQINNLPSISSLVQITSRQTWQISDAPFDQYLNHQLAQWHATIRYYNANN